MSTRWALSRCLRRRSLSLGDRLRDLCRRLCLCSLSFSLCFLEVPMPAALRCSNVYKQCQIPPQIVHLSFRASSMMTVPQSASNLNQSHTPIVVWKAGCTMNMYGFFLHLNSSLCLSVVVRKRQVAILTRSSREMSQTVRIEWQYALSQDRVSVRPRIFLYPKNTQHLGETGPPAPVFISMGWSVLWTGVGLRWLVTLVNHS